MRGLPVMSFLGWLSVGTLLAPPALVSQAGPQPAGRVEVTIAGIRAQQGGTLVVALYEREGGWLNLDSARAVVRLAMKADSQTAVFEGLPFDSSYAIAVIHDRNGNDKLDMRWFPFPKPREGAGVSQNHVRKGKPNYRQARFTVLDERVSIRIEMRY